MKLWAAIAPIGFEEELERELAWRGLKPFQIQGAFYLFEGDPQPLFWPQVIWLKVEKIEFSSISEAGKKLKPKAKKFTHYSLNSHRRGELILEGLRAEKDEIFEFPVLISKSESGAFCLLSNNELLFCRDFNSVNPRGEVKFKENKSAPSRAYLKLWEALALYGELPGKDDICLDLGASPGGWTWVLAQLGSQVISVDRSPLDASLMNNPRIQFQSGDAFQSLPKKIGDIDWLFSDVICYPEKLWELIEKWRENKSAKHFICTLKFQGDCDFDVVAKYAEHGKILHLYHNKHELTWISDFK